MILFGSFALRNATPRTAGLIYWSIVSLIGASLGAVVLRYTGTSTASTFLLTAPSLGALPRWGYPTQQNLTG